MKIPLIILIFTCCSFCFMHHLELKYPVHFPEISYDLTKNPLSNEKIQLGRKLFYDPILSKNNTVSCASCHSSYNAFAHTDHDLSHGIFDSIGLRNAPALFNLAWSKSFNWDGAINHLDMQALAPINDLREMGETTLNLIKKLNQDKVYKDLFEKNWGDTITTEYLLKSLSQFTMSLISSDSKYDKMMAGEIEFNQQEKKGYSLFKYHCNTCHVEPLFTGDFANNGLAIDSSLMDYGRGAITLLKEDSLSFKIPSLRNLSFTYPYMHDGRFEKLRQVINHYTTIDTSSAGLAKVLKSKIELSSNEQVDLIAFLLTLNDLEFTRNKDHQFPRE